MYFAGIDVGSTITKAVIIDDKGELLSPIAGPSGAEHRRLANKVMQEVLNSARLSLNEISFIVATGYGRFNVPFADRQITELTCHAKGVSTLFPNARTAIDIGGQDSKAMKINSGKLVDFAMNDKCAAGTGRFLDVTSKVLGLKIEELGNISLNSTNRVTISSVCTIFARQEILSHISNGVPLEDILAGLHQAIASKVVSMVKRLGVEEDVVLTGGVAKNIGVVKAVKENLGCEVFIPDDPLLSGAIGAAVLGKELVLKALAEGGTIERKERCLEEAAFFK